MVWMQLLSKKEVKVILLGAAKQISFPFDAIERWMEVLTGPPIPTWHQFHGNPLHTRSESVSKLLEIALGLQWWWILIPKTTAREDLWQGSGF